MASHPNPPPDLSQWTILFDLDGTLVDTLEDYMVAINHVLTANNLPALSRDQVMGGISRGTKKLLERELLPSLGTVDAFDLDGFLEQFFARYLADISHHSRPYPHTREVLSRLGSLGARFAVCTNKLQAMSEKLLNELDLAHLFAIIVGADAVKRRKPDGEHIRYCVHQVGGRIDKTIMIGDSSADIEAARDAKVPVIGVSWGYSVIPMVELAPDRIIDSMAGLPQAVYSLVQSGQHLPDCEDSRN